MGRGELNVPGVGNGELKKGKKGFYLNGLEATESKSCKTEDNKSHQDIESDSFVHLSLLWTYVTLKEYGATPMLPWFPQSLTRN